MGTTSIIEEKEEVGALLAQALSSTYVLYTKTHNFHWNVEGPRFATLHKLFEGQYEELAEAIDEIAERIRMLGIKAPGAMKTFLSLSIVKESEGDLSEDEMLEQLSRDHQTILDQLSHWIRQAQKVGDEGSADLLIQRERAHRKMCWMLSSHLSSHTFS